jgi:hypothetical protein
MTKVYTSWHLNINFSALEVESQKDVVDKCYWPLLNLVEDGQNFFGIEVSASTLSQIQKIDPAWLKKVKSLQDSGKIEIIASGWSQIISPLVPWRVTEKNLALGNDYYLSSLGRVPRVAFVNEQAWSDGLFDLYVDAGFEAIIIEWENSISINPDWKKSWKFSPVVLEKDGKQLVIIWNHSTAFQKLQRLAHNEISLKDWKDWFVGYVQSEQNSAICVYGGDVETIGFRPKRYLYEPDASRDEWDKIQTAFQDAKSRGFAFIVPSELIDHSMEYPRVSSISSIASPIPTKKQPKYNPLRWAVGGRDSVMANTKCQRVLEGLLAAENENSLIWQELVELWASDFRTHITKNRWDDWQERIDKLLMVTEKKKPAPKPFAGDIKSRFRITEDDSEILVSTDQLTILLSARKGLAVKELYFNSLSQEWLVGAFEHGDEADIDWTADFFSGEFVFEPPGSPKVSDLIPVKPLISYGVDYLSILAEIHSPLGKLEKEIRIFADSEKVSFIYKPLWDIIPAGSLRFGDIVLNPKAFELSTLTLETHNGGPKIEKFRLKNVNVDQGRAWSAAISARQCFGITEGYCLIGDKHKRIRVTNDQTKSKVPAILTFQNFRHTFLFRLQFSGRELDDTSFRHNIDLSVNPRIYEITIEAERESNG